MQVENTEFNDTLVDVEESLSLEDQREKQIMDGSVVLVNTKATITGKPSMFS